MFHKDNPEYNRRQIGFYTLDELVPKDHFLRNDWFFFYYTPSKQEKSPEV